MMMPMAMPGAPSAAAAEPEEEQTEFDAVLTEYPSDKKIAILKVVRSITGLGLKEAKELVESIPKPLKEGIAKEAAEDIKKQLEEIYGGGGTGTRPTTTNTSTTEKIMSSTLNVFDDNDTENPSMYV